MPPTNGQEAPKKIILRIGGNDLDLTDYPPLTLRDRKVMRKEYGLDFRKVGEFTDEEQDKFILFVLRRVRTETTEAEVEELPVKIAGEIASHAIVSSARVDSPFSPRSTSSQTLMAGASVKSEIEPSRS